MLQSLDDFFRPIATIADAVVQQIEKNNNRRRHLWCIRIAMERHDALWLALVGNLKVLAVQITDNLIVTVGRDNV